MGFCLGSPLGVSLAIAFLAATAFPSVTRAEPERIRIQYSAPKSCPDGTAFTRALRQRTGRFRLGSAVEQARVFVATITVADALVTGRLEIQGPGAEVSVRNVSGKTCEEVTDALALITALVLDPSAHGNANVSAPVPSPVSPLASSPIGATNRTKPKAAEASSPAAGAPREPEPSSTEPEPPPLPPPAAVEARATKPNPAVATGWRFSAGVQGGGSLQVSPTPGLGALLFVEGAAPHVLAPVLRAGLFWNQSDVSVTGGAGAEFRWATALVEGCPIHWAALDSHLGLFPCLAVHLGVLRGQGRNLDEPAGTTNLWADLGPVLRLRVAVLARLFLEAQGMLVFPLRRLTFDVQDRGPAYPPTTVFAVPRVGFLAGIGVGYAFE
jgi:hypothetical protein